MTWLFTSTVGDDHRLPVARLDRGVAPADLGDAADRLTRAERDPVADLIELSICSARPPITLPSVSCSEKPITAVSTALVVIRPDREAGALADRDQRDQRDAGDQDLAQDQRGTQADPRQARGEEHRAERRPPAASAAATCDGGMTAAYVPSPSPLRTAATRQQHHVDPVETERGAHPPALLLDRRAAARSGPRPRRPPPPAGVRPCAASARSEFQIGTAQSYQRLRLLFTMGHRPGRLLAPRPSPLAWRQSTIDLIAQTPIGPIMRSP